MQIEIACSGGYKVDNFIDELDNLYGRIEDTIEELENIYRGIANVNGGLNENLNNARTNIKCRINKEGEKKDSVLKIRKKAEDFYDTTIQIDKKVARQVNENNEKFFAAYSGLGMLANVEKSWWDKFVEGWKSFWSDVGDAIKTAWDGACEFFTEYAVEMIVGTIGFIVGAVVLYFAAGVTLASIAVLAVAALVGVLLEASIAGLIGWLQGGDFWEIFKEQFATGYMFAGIFFAVQAIFTAVVNLIKAKKAAKIVDKVDDVVDNVDDVKNPYPKTILDDLKGTENFKENSIEHIFEGYVRNGKGTGYHYDGIENTAGRIVEGTEEVINDFGVYKAKVEINGVPKSGNGGYSTFFPKDMGPQDVIDAINEAYTSKTFKYGNEYYGYTKKGMKITMYLDASGKIISAFPGI